MKPEQMLKQYGPIAIVLIVLYFLFFRKKNDPAQTNTSTDYGGALGSNTGGVVPTNQGGSEVPTNGGSTNIPNGATPVVSPDYGGVSDPLPWKMPDNGVVTSDNSGTTTALTVKI